MLPGVNGPRVFTVLAAVLIVGFLVSVWAQRDIGLADNSDFTRAVYTFSSGPAGLPPGWLDYYSEVGHQRYFYYWLPRWNLHWFIQRPITSAELLWLPGVLAAAVGIGGGQLDLRIISLFPKLLLLGELALIGAWAWRQTASRVLLLLTLGLPAVLVFTTMDYLAFLQSFYQEAGTLVFILPLLFSLLAFYRRSSGRRLAVTLACLILLTAAKTANIYWPLLVSPFLIARWLAAHPEYNAKRRRWTVAASILGVLVLTLATLRATNVGGRANPYQSLFLGALTFSRHPDEHLEKLHLQWAADCLDQGAYSPVGMQFLAAHPTTVTYRQVLLTYARDPGAVGSAVAHVFGRMQDISLEFLGKRAFDDPRASHPATRQWDSTVDRFWDADSEGTLWNGWSAFKFHCFPTGAALGVCLLVFAGWFFWQFRGPEVVGRELAIVGGMATLACPVDMGVAILGEGRADLIKHLFFANLLFDIAAVAFLAGVAVWIQQAAARRSSSKVGRSVPAPP